MTWTLRPRKNKDAARIGQRICMRRTQWQKRIKEYPYWSLKERAFHRFCTRICQHGPSVLRKNVVTFSSKLLKNIAGEASLLESRGKCRKTDRDDVVLKCQSCTHFIEKQIGVDHKQILNS